MKAIETDKEQLYFNHYDPSDLEHIIDTQHKIIKLMKASNRKKQFLIFIVIDDGADDAVFTRQSKLLHALYTTGKTQHHKHHIFYTKVCGDSPYH